MEMRYWIFRVLEKGKELILWPGCPPEGFKTAKEANERILVPQAFMVLGLPEMVAAPYKLTAQAEQGVSEQTPEQAKEASRFALIEKRLVQFEKSQGDEDHWELVEDIRKIMRKMWPVQG
jgi:hypothetical protein